MLEVSKEKETGKLSEFTSRKRHPNLPAQIIKEIQHFFGNPRAHFNNPFVDERLNFFLVKEVIFLQSIFVSDI